MRYLDPDLSPSLNTQQLVKYAATVGAEYDEVGIPLDKLRAGDVVVTGPWTDWSWLPAQVGIEVIPDGTPPASRVDPIIVALHERGVPVGFRNEPPKTERSQYWEPYHDAVRWVNEVASLVHLDTTVTVKDTAAPFTVVEDADEARHVLASLHGRPFAFDFETDGLDVRKVSRIGLALADDRHAWWLTDTVTPGIMPDLISLLQDPDSEPRASGVSYDLRVLAAWTKFQFEPMSCLPWDTQVMHWLWSGGSYVNDLKSITKKLLKRDVLTFDDVGGPELFWSQPHETQALYAAAGDARNSYDLVELLKHKLRERGVYDLYVNIEQPVTPVLAEMELAGLPIDRSQLLKLCLEYEERKASILKELTDLGFEGTPTNDNHIIHFLFDKLGLPVLERTPKKQQPRVSTDIMRQLSLLRESNANVRKHLRVLELVIEFSEVDKALNTFLIPPLESMIPWMRASVRQTSVVTGRISTSNPNIMNIPSRAGKRIRQIIIAPDGKILVDSDYSTLEPRVGAEWSQDPDMLSDFRLGKDVYISLAADMGLGEIQKGNPIRDMVKIVYLADLYGTSPVKIQVIGLKSDIFIPVATARDYQRGIHQARSHYYAQRDQLVKRARITGEIRDMFNRWKPAGALNAVDPGTRDAAARGVMNFPNQGGAGGIIKGSMPDIQRLYKSAGGTLCNQIHDELLGWVDDMPEAQLEEFVAEKERMMCWYQPHMSVPLKVETGWGHTWYEAKK